MSETTAKSTTSSTSTVEKPEEKKTLARKINAWAFVVLLMLVLLVFGPVASFLSWRSNTLEGANTALKVIFAMLAYIGNIFYILWFAIMKTIFPKPVSTTSPMLSSITSSFSKSAPSPTPMPASLSPFSPSPQPQPTAATQGPAPANDDVIMLTKRDNLPPIANQQGGKKTKIHRRK